MSNLRETFDKALGEIKYRIGKVYREMTGGGELLFEKINEYGYDLEGVNMLVRPPLSGFVRREALSGG